MQTYKVFFDWKKTIHSVWKKQGKKYLELFTDAVVTRFYALNK